MSSQTAKKPHVLVTNDDGTDSVFLHLLVEALLAEFRVSVAAPAGEQSWIGRAISRRAQIEVKTDPYLTSKGATAWSVDGTPTDCVNIALGNLLDEPPDIMVSGINIGYNTTEALIFSSGTVAGAMEGAFWELPAIAFSQKVPQDLFESVRLSKGQAEGAFAKSLRAAAGHAAAITGDALKTTKTYGQVININFPETTAASTEIVDTYPERIHLGSLYEEVAPNRYEFRFKEGIRMEASDATDRAVLASGRISRSALVFPQVGTRPRS